MNLDFTLLSDDEVFGRGNIALIKQKGRRCAVTDFAILLGAAVDNESNVPDDESLKGRTCWWYLSSSDESGNITSVQSYTGHREWAYAGRRNGGIRPVLPFYSESDIAKEIKTGLKDTISKAILGKNHITEISYGEYPQYIVDDELANLLETMYKDGSIKETGKTYTTDSVNISMRSDEFTPSEHIEYYYEGRKFVRVEYNDAAIDDNVILSNGKTIKQIKNAWIEVEPIEWYIDTTLGLKKLLVSKRCLASGVRFCKDGTYFGTFEKTEMYEFLNKAFAKNIIPSDTLYLENSNADDDYNPLNLKFKKLTEEDIIKGAIESDVPVFLHGPSSEGKSARVKQIDPDLTIIYLKNASPESLNGKSVYNSKAGKMIDIKPTWLIKLEEKCKNEPDKKHVLFFDELTNALPNVQGIAFNIILEHEVNGLWKLPENTRIVAAGNEKKDSLAANEMAKPMFSRFAHVYIKTTTHEWLKWASQNNIHPAIYLYIAYKNGLPLRSDYDGKKPNADPRKWEMASKMLCQTGNPEDLRSIVGEKITDDFVDFCKTPVITLFDVISNNYDMKRVNSLDEKEKYAMLIRLSQVNEVNLNVVRDFLKEVGNKYLNIFDTLWTHGDEDELKESGKIKSIGEK